jgi:ribosome-dependent ATPase
LAYSYRETLEILRDPVRLTFAFLGSVVLMLVFGFGITLDVEHIRYAVFDQDQSPESREYLEAFDSPRFFSLQDPIGDEKETARRLKGNDISMAIEIPPQFGRDLQRGSQPEVSALIDGANPFRAETIQQYAIGANRSWLVKAAESHLTSSKFPPPTRIESRFVYNPTFESVFAIVPCIPAILLVLIPAILMAVSVVREKELGSIVNFYTTPSKRLDFLLGKQLPYVVIGMLNYLILVAMSIFVFGVPLKGSAIMLSLCALLYVIATTGFGLLISTFTSSQVAAVFITAILTILPTTQFSGMLQPVSTLDGGARVVGTIWPTTYYMHASVGAFTKALGPRVLMSDVVALAIFIPVFTTLAAAALKKQEL